MIKAISSNKIIEAHFVEGINQANQLVLSLPLKERLKPNIFYALFEKPDSTEYLMFKLISEDVQNDRVTYNGVDAACDELKGYGYVKDIRPVKRTAKEILQRVLQDTRWEVGYIDSTNPVDTNFYYQTYLDCIQQIVKLFNLEVTFTYGFDTKHQQITSRKVNLYLQQGRRTGKRFEYGSNLLEVTREEDSQNIVTALVGRGKGEEKYDDSTGEPTDGYGRRIGFSDVVWSKANGDPVDKPLGQEYVEDPEATKIFGYDDGKPRTGVIIFDDIDDPVELLKATWASLKSSDRPKVSFKAQVTDVGNLQLGDTIAIIRHEISIEYFTRVFKVDHDLLNKNNSTIEMGDDMSDRSLYSYISDVDATAKQAVQSANQATVSAGSKNKNYYATTKPAIADEGDNLWLNLGNGEFEHWVWHNHQWQFINSTQDLHNVEQSVKDQQAELDKVKQSANDANSKVDDLNQNTTANIATIKADLKSAQDDVASAKQEIQANGGKILSVDKRVDGLSVAVGNNTNSISKVDQKADVIKQTVANNTKDISTVTQTANSVSSIVNDENTGLSAVLQKVNSVSSVVNDKEHGLSAVNQKADSLATQIVGKVDTSQLIQLSDQIKTKVESKDFTSQINQVNNNINLKVSKGDVLGQINIEAGSTLIQNKKLYLDADSVVFSGKAFIPDAAITNISADKINAGTLDAGKINVININADNINSGSINGVKSQWDLTTGRLSLGDEKVRLDLQDGQIGITSNDETGDYFFQLKKEYVYKQGSYSHWKNLPVLALENKWGIGLITEVPKDHWSWGDLATNYSDQIHPGLLIRDVMNLYDWGQDINDPSHKFVPTDAGIVLQGGQTGVQIIGGDSFTTYFGDTRLDVVPNIFVGYTNYGSFEQGKYTPHTCVLIQASQIHLMTGTEGCLVTGNFGVTGNKNAVVPTSNGMTAINAYETAEYYFGDIGKSKTDKNGQALIQLDPLFLETVNTSIPYHVFVSPYGNANVWVEQMDRNSFLVKSSKPNIEFSWEIKAKRLGYEDDRLKIIQKEIPKELIPQYRAKGIL